MCLSDWTSSQRDTVKDSSFIMAMVPESGSPPVAGEGAEEREGQVMLTEREEGQQAAAREEHEMAKEGREGQTKTIEQDSEVTDQKPVVPAALAPTTEEDSVDLKLSKIISTMKSLCVEVRRFGTATQFPEVVEVEEGGVVDTSTLGELHPGGGCPGTSKEQIGLGPKDRSSWEGGDTFERNRSSSKTVKLNVGGKRVYVSWRLLLQVAARQIFLKSQTEVLKA